MIFFAFVFVPSLKNVSPEQRIDQIRTVGLATRTIGWISLLVLLTTGGLNTLHLWPSWQSLAGQLLLAKISIVVGLVGLMILHDFVLAPKLTAIRRAAGGSSPAFLRLQSTVRWISRTTLILALCVVLLAVLLTRS